MNLREWALPLYTILIQIACGGMLILWLIRSIYSRRYGQEELNQMTNTPLMVIFCTIGAGMLGAHFHLMDKLNKGRTIGYGQTKISPNGTRTESAAASLRAL